MTPVQSAFKNLQDTQNALVVTKNRLNNANAVLAADPQKWSTTILTFENSQVTRANLQAMADGFANAVSNFQNVIPSLQKLYDDAVKAEAAASNTQMYLANPSAAANAAVAVETAKINADSKTIIAQSTTKYLIWGVVALVIVVVAIVIYKKKFAK